MPTADPLRPSSARHRRPPRRWVAPTALSALLTLVSGCDDGASQPPPPIVAVPEAPEVPESGPVAAVDPAPGGAKESEEGSHGEKAQGARVAHTAPPVNHAQTAQIAEFTGSEPPEDLLDPRDLAAYTWLAPDPAGIGAVVDTLDRRFPAPPGFARVEVDPGSFGAYLRGLPLTAAASPVLAYDGRVILGAGHPNLAAVAALDIGDRDLQQCADSILRLHAEWLFAQGRRDHTYRAASGVDLPFARYLSGERVVLVDKRLEWQKRAKPRAASREALQGYLRSVFAWANTESLARQAQAIPRERLRPGDFFVLPGGPGHAVQILDVARADDGRLALLLGQGFMPAQSFHVLRPGAAAAATSPWFVVEPGAPGVTTPFWAPFPWSSLRRLDRDRAAK